MGKGVIGKMGSTLIGKKEVTGARVEGLLTRGLGGSHWSNVAVFSGVGMEDREDAAEVGVLKF